MASALSRWVGRVALVTGGSAGIGKATARLLVKEGMKVVVCGRNVETLQTLATELNQNKSEPPILAVQCDVSKEDQVLGMFNQIRSKFGRLDVCINSAGINLKHASLLDGSTESWQKMIDVNVIGLCICTRESVKLMRENGIDDGHIIHLGSLAGHTVPPAELFHFYAASKFAVNACTEGLRQELRAIKSNIRVSTLSPGMVATTFLKEHIEGDYERFLSSWPNLTPEDTAQIIWMCIQQPAHVQIHDILLRPTQQIF